MTILGTICNLDVTDVDTALPDHYITLLQCLRGFKRVTSVSDGFDVGELANVFSSTQLLVNIQKRMEKLDDAVKYQILPDVCR